MLVRKKPNVDVWCKLDSSISYRNLSSNLYPLFLFTILNKKCSLGASYLKIPNYHTKMQLSLNTFLNTMLINISMNWGLGFRMYSSQLII